MDDGRPTTDDDPTAVAGGPGIGQEAKLTGNSTLATLGYLIWLVGFTGFLVDSFLLISTKPQFVGQGWALLWFGALAIVGLVLLKVNGRALKAPTKGKRLLGQILAQLGIILSMGFVFWLVDSSWGSIGLGIAFLVGSVALFTVGMLIALDKNAVDDSRQGS
jgi:hypothetical protein